MKKNLKIGNRLIGDKFKTFIIAEIGQAHNGKISQLLTNHLEKDLILKLKTDLSTGKV